MRINLLGTKQEVDSVVDVLRGQLVVRHVGPPLGGHDDIVMVSVDASAPPPPTSWMVLETGQVLERAAMKQALLAHLPAPDSTPEKRRPKRVGGGGRRA